MIRVAAHFEALGPRARYGLSVLLDLARAIVVEDPAAPIVSLELFDAPTPASLASVVEARWGIVASDGVVQLPAWALERIADLAGAGAEQAVTEADRYGRVPSASNPLIESGFARRPVVQEAGMQLRAAVGAAAGRRPVRFLPPWPDGHRWAAAISHDVDVVDWWPAFTALRLVELLKRGRLGLAAEVGVSALRATLGDPVWQGLDQVLRLEAELGIRSTWFLLTGTPSLATMSRGDLTYLPEGKRARRLMRALRAAGHEIGLHGSFATMLDRRRFNEERERLASLADRPVRAVRQHYLRFRPGTSQREMCAAGFSYDASYGFADRNGFRLGVADVVPAWDATASEPSTHSALEEVPLTWMDRALSKYAGIERPEAWIDDGLELAEECRRVEGLFVALWHPNLVPALGYPGAPEQLRRLLKSLLANEPYMRPLGEIVRWRTARRAIRATGIASDGTPLLVGHTEEMGTLHLEDANGREVQTLSSPRSGRG